MPVTTRQWNGFLSHTLYWDVAKGEVDPPHVVALRGALNLLDEEEAAEGQPGEAPR